MYCIKCMPGCCHILLKSESTVNRTTKNDKAASPSSSTVEDTSANKFLTNVAIRRRYGTLVHTAKRGVHWKDKWVATIFCCASRTIFHRGTTVVTFALWISALNNSCSKQPPHGCFVQTRHAPTRLAGFHTIRRNVIYLFCVTIT